MAQVIRHRRGSLDLTSITGSATTNYGEIVIGTGSLSNVTGPLAFIASGSSYYLTSRTLTGTTTPTITNYPWLDGLMFWNTTGTGSLYILKAAGNIQIPISSGVAFGSSAGQAVEGNTTLTIQGTANEISVSGGSITLGAGGTVTLSLPSTVDLGAASSITATTGSFGHVVTTGNVVVGGNLTVNGTTTIVNSTAVSIGDRIIELNAAAAAGDSGLLVYDADNSTTGSILWETTGQYWKAGANGSEFRVVRQNSTSAMTQNALTRVDGSGNLVATAAPSTTGDIPQWDGSTFQMSNVVDGGTF